MNARSLADAARRIAVLALFAYACAAPARADITGDTFAFGMEGWFNSPANPGSGWDWYPTDSPNGGPSETVGVFTFGTPGTFDFLGNTLVLSSTAISTGPDTQRWIFSLTAQDGGLIFDPAAGYYDAVTNPNGVRAFHLREFTFGSYDFSPPHDNPAFGVSDLLNDPDFATFATLPDDYTGIGDWISNSSRMTFFDANGPASTDQGNLSAGEVDADFNGDRDVDGADFLTWQRQFFTLQNPGSGADADGNGFVDEFDFAEWADEYGTVVPTVFGDTPGTISMFAKVEPDGILMNRQFSSSIYGDGFLLYDDGIGGMPNDVEAVRIEFSLDVRLSPSGSSIPEPAGLCSVLIGLLALGHARRKPA